MSAPTPSGYVPRHRLQSPPACYGEEPLALVDRRHWEPVAWQGPGRRWHWRLEREAVEQLLRLRDEGYATTAQSRDLETGTTLLLARRCEL